MPPLRRGILRLAVMIAGNLRQHRQPLRLQRLTEVIGQLLHRQRLDGGDQLFAGVKAEIFPLQIVKKTPRLFIQRLRALAQFINHPCLYWANSSALIARSRACAF